MRPNPLIPHGTAIRTPPRVARGPPILERDWKAFAVPSARARTRAQVFMSDVCSQNRTAVEYSSSGVFLSLDSFFLNKNYKKRKKKLKEDWCFLESTSVRTPPSKSHNNVGWPEYARQKKVDSSRTPGCVSDDGLLPDLVHSSCVVAAVAALLDSHSSASIITFHGLDLATLYC